MFAALDDLTTALGRLEAGLQGCDDDTLDAVMPRLAGARIRFEAMWLQAVALSEDRALHRRHGARDAAGWVAGLAGDRKGTARKDVDLARQLTRAPQVADAMAAGDVSKAKAAELVWAAELPEDVQATLVAEASAQAVEEVSAAVERARLVHGAQSAPPSRELTITRRADHAKIEGTVDLVEAEILDVAFSTMADTLGLPVEMPYSERRAHALVGLARYYLEHQTDAPSGRVGRPHVVVLVGLETLEARAGGFALMTSGAVITGDQARRLAEDANISRIITKGVSEPLDVGRATRSVPPAMAKAVIARDRCCRYGGCTAPPWACDVHHRTPWARGGPTAIQNLGLLCWFHHDLVHRGGPEHLTTTPEGRWTLAAGDVRVAA